MAPSMKNEPIHFQPPQRQNEEPAVVSLAHRKQQQAAWEVAAAVLDPEVPAVTVAELGILRDVIVEPTGTVIARLTPTYSGCPAVLAIEDAVKKALEDHGYRVKIERVLCPAWTTDWISDKGLEKLRAYGIAPPEKTSTQKRRLFSTPTVACPNCSSENTKLISEFGSTACKAHYQCNSCFEPFDYFKCL